MWFRGKFNLLSIWSIIIDNLIRLFKISFKIIILITICKDGISFSSKLVFSLLILIEFFHAHYQNLSSFTYFVESILLSGYIYNKEIIVNMVKTRLRK